MYFGNEQLEGTAAGGYINNTSLGTIEFDGINQGHVAGVVVRRECSFCANFRMPRLSTKVVKC